MSREHEPALSLRTERHTSEGSRDPVGGIGHGAAHQDQRHRRGALRLEVDRHGDGVVGLAVLYRNIGSGSEGLLVGSAGVVITTVHTRNRGADLDGDLGLITEPGFLARDGQR